MIQNILENKNRIMIAISLITIGSIIRIILHDNLPGSPSIYITVNSITQPMFMLDLFFIIAIISLISGLILGGYYTFIVPISIMIITDLVIGNNWIAFFTWSGFAILGLIGFILKRKKSLTISHIPRVLGVGIGAILLYDIWTNFGTWLGGWYTHSLEGLALCYTNALPFMFWHLLSTTIAMVLLIVPIAYLKEHEINIPDFQIEKFERKITFVAPVILMVLALLSLVV
jgi:LPXTG-motif cell wall-anchored protein